MNPNSFELKNFQAVVLVIYFLFYPYCLLQERHNLTLYPEKVIKPFLAFIGRNDEPINTDRLLTL